jgi:hypothetical protein
MRALIAMDAGHQPELHRAAVRIATRIACLLQPVLRREEHDHAVRSIYALAREELEAYRECEASGRTARNKP